MFLSGGCVVQHELTNTAADIWKLVILMVVSKPDCGNQESSSMRRSCRKGASFKKN